MYNSENIKLNDIKIELPSAISTTEVKPDFITKLTRPISNWIPIVGDLIQLPIKITSALLPPLPSTSHPELPPDSDWNNPQFLKSIDELTLNGGYLRTAPVELRGADYKPEKCWSYNPFPVYKDCDDLELNKFLYEVRVYLTFLHEGEKVEDAQANPEILLATADSKVDYSAENKMLVFHTTKVNLRPYLLSYKKFDVKIVASGKLPSRNVYIDGALQIGLTIKLNK